MAVSVDHDGAGMMEASRLPVFTHYWDTNARIGGRNYWELDASFSLVLTGMFSGFLNLIVVVTFMCCKKLRPRPTVFKASLAFTHVFQILSSPFAAITTQPVTCNSTICGSLAMAWYVCTYSGIFLHLLVVLEFMLTRMKSPLSSKFQRLSWNVPAVLVSYLIGLVAFYSLEVYAFKGSVALALTLVIVIFTCVSCQSMDKRLALAVLSAVLTFGLTYFPYFVAVCMQLNHVRDNRFLILLFLTNMRLTADGFLCWVVCWGGPEAPQEQSEDSQVNRKPVTPTPYDSFQTNMRSSNF